jgi:hypothetical protein
MLVRDARADDARISGDRVVTEPGSVQHCLFFWNLRALRPLRLGTVPMLLLPVDHAQHWIGSQLS